MKSASHAHERQHDAPAPPPRPDQAAASGGHVHPARTAREPEHAAHHRHAGHSVEMFRAKFWVTLLFTIPTLVWSDMIQHWLRFSAPAFPGSVYIPALFGTAVYLYGGWVFLASGALRELAKLLPSTAQRVVGDRIEDVPISALAEGDLVLVRPGASIPADGVVRSGKSDVNESMITGESVPVEKVEGAKMIAGTVNGAGSLRVEVTGTGERTALANIMRLVEQAQTSRSRAQALADRAAFALTMFAIAAGVLTFVVWTALDASGAFAIERLVSVLVIACPPALGLAVPLVIAISTTLGARSGLLVRDRRGLEEARQTHDRRVRQDRAAHPRRVPRRGHCDRRQYGGE
jgi:cation transport ATPase